MACLHICPLVKREERQEWNVLSRTGKPATQLSFSVRRTKTMNARIGSILYIIWGLLHIIAAKKVYHLAQTLESGMVQGRVIQNAWNLLFFAVFAIVIAIFMNWKNSKTGYWLNLVVVSAADVGFILAILMPGYLPIVPGIVGPAVWILALVFSTIGIIKEKERLNAS